MMISTKIEPCTKTTTNKKVPGEVLPIGKLEDEAKTFEKEITKKTTPELQDLLERQNRILLNAKLIQALPDKGAKVRLRRQQLMAMIEQRERRMDNTIELLENISITNGRRKINTNKMEWKLGGANLMNQYAKTKNIDSDDDSDESIDIDNFVENDVEFQKNPLKILASRSEVASHRKVQNSPYISTEKVEKLNEIKEESLDTRFVPFNSMRHKTLTKDDTIQIEKSLTRRNQKEKKKPVELMPLPSENYAHLKATTIELKESIMLQKEQAEKLKEVQFKQAAEKLANSDKNCNIGDLASFTHPTAMAYRDPQFSSNITDKNILHKNSGTIVKNECH